MKKYALVNENFGRFGSNCFAYRQLLKNQINRRRTGNDCITYNDGKATPNKENRIVFSIQILHFFMITFGQRLLRDY